MSATFPAVIDSKATFKAAVESLFQDPDMPKNHTSSRQFDFFDMAVSICRRGRVVHIDPVSRLFTNRWCIAEKVSGMGYFSRFQGSTVLVLLEEE